MIQPGTGTSDPDQSARGRRIENATLVQLSRLSSIVATLYCKITPGDDAITKYTTVDKRICRFVNGLYQLRDDDEHLVRYRSREGLLDLFIPCSLVLNGAGHLIGFETDMMKDFPLKQVVLCLEIMTC